jgi:hypothetical protein
MNVNSRLCPSWRQGVNCRRSVLDCMAAAGCICLLLSIPGCKREGPEVVPVEGVITFSGGPWTKPGVLYFLPEKPAPGMPNRPATGNFDADGNITVSTFKKGDGLIPGKYKIGVEHGDVVTAMDSPTPTKSIIPQRYRSAFSSGLTVTVEPGQRVVKLNLEVAKE